MKLHASDHKVDLLFVMALFTIFCATAFLVVLIGARQYQITADNMNYNYEVRTTSSYLQEKLRQSDVGEEVSVCTLAEDVSALALYEKIDGVRYCTYIYYYDGFLRELYVTEESKFDLSAGQALLEINGFTPEIKSKTLVKMTFTGTDGIAYPTYAALHTACGKEAK